MTKIPNLTFEEYVTYLRESGSTRVDILKRTDRAILTHELRRARGVQSKAADTLGMHRNTFGRHMDELEIQTGTGRPKRVGSVRSAEEREARSA